MTPRPPGPFDAHWLHRAVRLSRSCPPSASAFSVGAVLVDPAGRQLADGHSRELSPLHHAEEAALDKLPTGTDLAGATLYSSLEPCGRRLSRPYCCSELVIAAGIRRVVIAWREPELFVGECRGLGALAAAGVVVHELPGFAQAARAVNGHLLAPSG
ncbi:dCMP deaminase [Kitasatospora sp. NPDC088783]|uniref:dCMP deaminase n=1 Tax=Kitasatospora sp. NPDC088783 TaxID=3364077 RepID=UPI0038190011